MNFEDMKKIYTNPALTVVILDSDDIVVTSGGDGTDSLGMKGQWDNNSASAKQRTNIWGEDE